MMSSAGCSEIVIAWLGKGVRFVATLNQIIAERKRKFVLLKRSLRVADSEIEKAERLIDRVLARKSKVPEVSDLLELVKMARNADGAIEGFLRGAQDGFPV